MRRRLHVESLEERRLLAVSTFQYAAPRSPGVESNLPSQLFEAGEFSYFQLDQRTSLWRTDGTSEGTIELGRFENQVFVHQALGDRLIFTGCAPRTGCELYASDGTVDGTRLLADTLLSRSTERTPPRPEIIGQLDDRILFAARGLTSLTLWSSDGTPEGTTKVTEVPFANYFATASADGRVYFGGPKSPRSNVTNALWVSDGTEEGTFQLWQLEGETEYISRIAYAAGKVFVSTNRALYVDVAGTGDFRRVESVTSQGGSTLTAVGDSLFLRSGSRFKHYDAKQTSEGTAGTVLATGLRDTVFIIEHVHGNQVFFDRQGELWVTDGTIDGTLQLLEAGSWDSFVTTDRGITIIAGTQHSTDTARDVVWRTDGTKEGTSLIPGSTRPASFSFVRLSVIGPWVMTSEKNVVQFVIDSDGTSFKSVDSFLADYPLDLMRRLSTPAINSVATDFFLGRDPLRGLELWRWEETEPALVHEFFPDPVPTTISHLFASKDFGYFIEDGKLWRTDGSSQQTEQIQFPTKFEGHVDYGGRVGDRHAFAVRSPADDSGTYHELWGIDGGSVRKLTSSRQYTHYFDASGAAAPTSTDETVWFEYFYGEQGYSLIWFTDGTPSGTHREIDGELRSGQWEWAGAIDDGLVQHSTSQIVFLGDRRHLRHDFGQRIRATKKLGDGLLVWVARTADLPEALWYWTPSSSRRLAEFQTRVANEFESFNHQVLFQVGSSLWATDGTEGGTRVLAEDVGSRFVGATEDAYIFTAVAEGVGRELWRTDGTPDGTFAFAELTPGEESPSFSRLPAQEHNGNVYFLADDRRRGMELWVTDGTEQGTHIVEETVAGPESLRINAFAVTPERIFMVGPESQSQRSLMVITPDQNPADANRDGEVDFRDFLFLAAHYQTEGATPEQGDFDGDGMVDEQDLEILVRNYGLTQTF